MLKRLRLLREAAGLTQKALAERIGVSQQSINKYENHNIEPDIGTLLAIADCFNTSVDYLIGRGDDIPPDTNCPSQARSADEQALLEDYSRLCPEQKQLIHAVIKNFLRSG